jgi:N-acetylneuraminate synthase
LKGHAEERGLLFLSSPFSREAAELLERLDVRAWKVASGEVTNPLLLDFLLATRKPILLSSGMSPLAEIDATVEKVRAAALDLAVMQCTSAYPCPPEKVGLNLIPLFRARYGCAVGLSDHSGTVYPGLAGAAIGIDVLEVHVTMSRRMFGPDVPVSLEPDEIETLVRGVRFIETMNAHPVEKDFAAGDLETLRRTFTKSIVARRDLAAGTVLAAEHLTAKKPGTGIPAARLPELVGRRLRTEVDQDTLIEESMLE